MFQCIGTNPAGSVQAAARLEIIEPGNLLLFLVAVFFSESAAMHFTMVRTDNLAEKKVYFCFRQF